MQTTKHNRLWAASMACVAGCVLAMAAAAAQEPARITVDAGRSLGPVEPLWRFFGYDEGNYTFMPEGRALLADLAELRPSPVYIRCHHLLTSGDGSAALKWSSTNVYREDEFGNPIHDWTILDRILDTFTGLGLKPFVEIGFMPEALSSADVPYTPNLIQHGEPRGMVGTGAFYPPKDYGKWAALIEAWGKHCKERYGEAEASSWYWELWNEPNIGYWKGTTEEYLRLYDYTAAALKGVLPKARLGGPHVTNPKSRTSEPFLRAFLEHCIRGKNAATGGTGAPVDFLAFHAKGGTSRVEDHVRMNLGNQLAEIDRGLSIIASYPEMKDKPVIVGECDPDGCAACSARLYPQNDYRNGSQYAAYTAATFLRYQTLAARHGMRLEGALTWAFTFPGQPWFDGFRTLATHGVAKPVLNAFRMFSLLGPDRVLVSEEDGRSLDSLMTSSVREAPDVSAFASRGERMLTVLVWNYHDDAVPGPDAPVHVAVQGLPEAEGLVRLTHYRIDGEHSNAYTAWLGMGAPETPTEAETGALEAAGALDTLTANAEIPVKNGKASLTFELPRQGLSLLLLEW